MRTFLVILFALVSLTAFSQNYGFEFKTGYGSFMMKDLSADLHYNKDKLNKDVDIKVVDDFPAYFNFGGNWFIDLDRYEFGVGYTFMSTGGRVHYKDYSGEVGLEHLFRAHSVSGIARYNFMRKEKFKLDFTTQLSFNLTLLKTSTWSRIGTDEDRVSGKFTGKSAGLTVLVGGKYYFTPQIYGGARAGVFADSQAMLKLDENNKIHLVDHNGDTMRSDWTGWRAEVFIGYALKP